MVADFAAGLPVSKYIILSLVMLIYVIGGCVMDALGFLVITIPIFFPLGLALGFDPIWYSIVLTMVTTLGAITPPVGVNIYVVKALAPQIGLGEIFKSVSFFVAASVMCIVILTIFPEIALLLPGLLRP
jgi:C4-dicarboxylate transporter, DctM subunit